MVRSAVVEMMAGAPICIHVTPDIFPAPWPGPVVVPVDLVGPKTDLPAPGPQAGPLVLAKADAGPLVVRSRGDRPDRHSFPSTLAFGIPTESPQSRDLGLRW